MYLHTLSKFQKERSEANKTSRSSQDIQLSEPWGRHPSPHNLLPNLIQKRNVTNGGLSSQQGPGEALQRKLRVGFDEPRTFLCCGPGADMQLLAVQDIRAGLSSHSVCHLLDLFCPWMLASKTPRRGLHLHNRGVQGGNSARCRSWKPEGGVDPA